MAQGPADGVSVAGTGRVPVSPDLMLVTFGAEVTESSVRDALDRCSRAAAAMVGQLRQGGVDPGDLQTAGASLYQALDPNGRPRGFTANQDLTARLRDLDRVGDLISMALNAAGPLARLRALRFDVDRGGESYRAGVIEARRRAFVDAEAAARQYAELSGRQLGVVMALQEGDGGYSPPIPMRQAAFTSGVPVEPGEIDITIKVEVRWELLG